VFGRFLGVVDRSVPSRRKHQTSNRLSLLRVFHLFNA
jgi:hypothetical protein